MAHDLDEHELEHEPDETLVMALEARLAAYELELELRRAAYALASG